MDELDNSAFLYHLKDLARKPLYLCIQSNVILDSQDPDGKTATYADQYPSSPSSMLDSISDASMFMITGSIYQPKAKGRRSWV